MSVRIPVLQHAAASGIGDGLAQAIALNRMLSDFTAYQLAKCIYQYCKKTRVSYSMRDQLARASASIALNVAEGSGKKSRTDQARYYAIALGSLRECQAILDLEDKYPTELVEQFDRLGAILFKLSHQT